MDSMLEKLDDAKAEIEKLREQYRVKAELADNLKRAHDEQLSKNKETSSKLEKLAQELNEKDDEISTTRQMYKELKSTLKEKESIIKQLSSSHDKLRFDCNEKLQKCEQENRALALALDDADAKNMDQEQQISALKKGIEGVKGVLNTSQKRCLETENRTKASKEKLLVGREDEFIRLEEENQKFSDQLKWKREQFVHLQEAHEKLRNQFKMKEKEWEKEKGELLDGISSLEMKLESQTRISEDLQRRLEMCNQALAHAESKKKMLEVHLLESKTNFDNICDEYGEARLSFENLTTQRDQEIATLRSSLGTKEILYKEMEYQFKKLESEKQEMLVSLKELQEAGIREGGFSSASKLQNKLKSLEQAHKGCSTNLKAKESEWRLQMEKLSEELNSCRLALKSRDTSLNELNRELEVCDSLILNLELLNEETSLVLLVLKSEFSEAQISLAADTQSCMNLKNKQVYEENIYELVEQLEGKKAALDSVQKDLEEEREKVVILSNKVQTLEELQFPLQKEVERLKEMLKESTTCHVQSKEEVMQIQSDLKRVHDALDRANEELYEKFCEANEIEFELRIWKSIAEKMEASLKQNHQMRRDVEASLLAQTDVEINLKQERESLSHQLEEREKRIDDLQQQLAEANESMKEGHQRELVENKIEVSPEKESKHEKENILHQLVEEKDRRIYDLQQLVASLEREFESSTASFSARLSQMQKDMNVLHESWEKIKEDEVLKEVEIQEKNIVIVELESDLGNLQQRVEQQEKVLFDSEKRIGEMQVELRGKEVVVHELECELEAKTTASEKTIGELTENSMNLSSENKSLVGTMDLISERMEQLAMEDMKLRESLGKIVYAIEISMPQNGSKSDDDDDDDDDDDEEEEEEEDPVKENVNFLSSPLMKKVEVINDERSPLRTINN